MTPISPSKSAGPDGLVQTARRAFVDRFGRPPVWAAAAPGRVNLIGEHTDYNGGFVLPMAIDRYAAIVAGPDAGGDPGRMRLHSATLHSFVDLDLTAPQRRGSPSWSNYVRGVVAEFQRRGVAIPALSAVILSEVPLGGGLSSSAALEVAMATLLEVASGVTLDPLDKARLCRRAEHEFAGVPCGLMDQLVSVLGEETGPLLIDCRSERVRSVSLAGPAVSFLVANTRVRHSLGDGAYARRKAECEQAAAGLGVESLRDATPEMVEAARGRLDPTLYRRARHVVGENARTLQVVSALERGDPRAAGAFLYESHRSLRDDYEVSCKELDVLVEAAHDLGENAGVHGSRMTGAGFGGCTVTIVQTDEVDAVSREIHRRYERRTGRAMDAFVSRPARGAHALDPGPPG